MSDKNVAIKETSISDIKDFIATRLRPRLPNSLPLLRRCQFHINHKQANSKAEIWIAEAVKTSGGDAYQDKDSSQNRVEDQDSTWIAAHIDLSNAGQTQVWVFASWEVEFSKAEKPGDAAKTSSDFPIFEALFNALRNRLRRHHIPDLSDTPPPQWQRLKDSGKRVSEPYSKSKVLFGTVADTLWPHLEEAPNQTISRTDMSYYKYIIASRRSSLLALADPPAGLHFEPMRKDHLQTMIDRTNIPRSLETIQQLPNIALYDESDTPIAWCLLSKDASIGSLHTEPEYRRKGLAELTARRLVVEQVKLFDNDPIEEVDPKAVIWSHADVSDANIPSQRVMEKIGGERMWRSGWIEVDIAEH